MFLNMVCGRIWILWFWKGFEDLGFWKDFEVNVSVQQDLKRCEKDLGVDFGRIWRIFCFLILADLARLERPLSLDIGCGCL